MAWGYRTGSYGNNGAGVNVPAIPGTTTVNLGAACSSGDVVVLHVVTFRGTGSGTPSHAVSDTVNGSWPGSTLTMTQVVVGHDCRQSIFCFPNSAALSTSNPITVTVANLGGGDDVNVGLEVAAFSGVATSSILDAFCTANGTSATPSSGSTTNPTTAANELIIGCYGDYGEGQTITQGSGFTLAGKHDSDSGRWQGLMEYADSGASGSSPAATVTLPGSNTAWGMLCVVLKVIGAGPPQDTPELYGRMPGNLSTSRQLHQLLAT